MNNLFKISSVFFIVIFITQCASNVVQNVESQDSMATNTGAAVVRPNDEAKIDGKLEKINLPDLKLETFVSQPPPDIRFVFSCRETEKDKCSESNLTAELEDEAKKLLADYWRKALTYIYKHYLKKDEYMLNGDIYYKTSVEHVNNSLEFEKNLRKVFINAPNGKRQISYTEANEIIGFINKSAFEIAKQAKNN